MLSREEKNGTAVAGKRSTCRKDNHGADEVISCHIEALAVFSENDARVSLANAPRCYRRPSPLVIGTVVPRRQVTAGTEVYRSPYPAKIPGHGPTGAFDSINQITKATPMSQAYRRPVMMLPLRRPPPRGDRQSLSTP